MNWNDNADLAILFCLVIRNPPNNMIQKAILFIKPEICHHSKKNCYFYLIWCHDQESVNSIMQHTIVPGYLNIYSLSWNSHASNFQFDGINYLIVMSVKLNLFQKSKKITHNKERHYKKWTIKINLALTQQPST